MDGMPKPYPYLPWTLIFEQSNYEVVTHLANMIQPGGNKLPIKDWRPSTHSLSQYGCLGVLGLFFR